MGYFRHHQKLISLLFLLGFFLATMEIHADHDLNAAQQSQHCCVQCCPTHNLAPANQDVMAVEEQIMVQSHIDDDSFLFLKEIPHSIFRPPIALI